MLKAYMVGVAPDSRAYAGCFRFELYTNQDDANHLGLIEEWESREQYQRYLDWRNETGVIPHIVSMLTEPPILRYFDRVDG